MRRTTWTAPSWRTSKHRPPTLLTRAVTSLQAVISTVTTAAIPIPRPRIPTHFRTRITRITPSIRNPPTHTSIPPTVSPEATVSERSSRRTPKRAMRVGAHPNIRRSIRNFPRNSKRNLRKSCSTFRPGSRSVASLCITTRFTKITWKWATGITSSARPPRAPKWRCSSRSRARAVRFRVCATSFLRRNPSLRLRSRWRGGRTLSTSCPRTTPPRSAGFGCRSRPSSTNASSRRRSHLPKSVFRRRKLADRLRVRTKQRLDLRRHPHRSSISGTVRPSIPKWRGCCTRL
mmetsp:Transcript_9751/g.16729  ORF Transcript_9751/g.16729 Transcript_9751/m.16729 type:complete len:289 (+) Transcript_9751:540-1406(+)